MRIRVVFLPDYPLVLSLLKHINVGAFFIPNRGSPLNGFKGHSLFGMDISLGPKFFYTLRLSKEKNSIIIQ